MIIADRLSKTFTVENIDTRAICDISLSIRTGEFVAVMGPSGCGKSTLLHLMGLLDRPTSGSLSVFGRNVHQLKEQQLLDLRKGRIGFVFQSFNLIDELTVYENVELPLVYMDVPGLLRRKLVLTLLEQLGIVHRQSHYPQQLSGGQQQRAAFARAVVAKPRLLLADEPTGNLDSGNGNEIMQLLGELHRDGATIVMVTHSPACANHADRTLHLFDGHLVG